MNPLDLAGPAFLSFFLMAALAAFAATLALRWLVARPLRRGDPAEIAAGLPPTEVAFLLGDLDRAVEAAVVGLHHRGLVEADGGTLRRTGASDAELQSEGVYRGAAVPRRRPRVEDFVLAHLPATMGDLCEAARSSHLGAELRARLEDEDLLVRDPDRASWSVRVPGFAWLVLGSLKLCIGLARERPVGVLFLLLVAGGALLFSKVRAPRLTRLGQAVAEQLRWSAALETTAQSAPQQLSGAEMERAYAIFGYAVAPAAVMVLMPSYHAAMLAASAGATGGGSSCSSCSSCGGGCGGCGGCS